MRWLKLVVISLLGIGLLGLVYDATTRPAYAGPTTERFNGTTFTSISYEEKKAADLLKWRMNRRPGPWEHRATRQASGLVDRENDNLRITLVNHSTLLIQIAGVNVLTDPVWSNSVGPFGRFGPSRFREPGIRFEDLPPIDAVFVSHSHYDHMDLPTLRRLFERDRPRFIVGLGNSDNLAKVGIGNVIELDWWQRVSLSESLDLTMTPAQHWSKRTVLDTNRTLWGSFVLRQNHQAVVFFAGDTGYGKHFEDIHNRLGRVKVALMPIGAYLPRWFMQGNHLSPAEALKASAELRSDVMIPMHFGTFALGDDGQDEPLVDLLAAYRPITNELTADKPGTLSLRVIDNGQTAVISQAMNNQE